jgi:outer membrane protein
MIILISEAKMSARARRRFFQRCIFLAAALLFATVVESAEPPPLTLHQARNAALQHHPRITIAELRALASRQGVREARAGFFPLLTGNIVAVGTAGDNTRLAALGGLNNPSIFERNAEGLNLTQLITDFGRTANLMGTARLRAEAEESNVQAAREQILLEVDAAYYAALEAQSVARVAEGTIQARQSFLEQVSALATNKMRSELDVSFARVNLEDARLLASKAKNDEQAALTQLSTLMGLSEPGAFTLAENPPTTEISTNVASLVELALKSRPDLIRLQRELEAALSFARAEKALSYPTVSAAASAGVVPIHDPQLPDNYAAAGVGVSIPLFAGGLYRARHEEAELRAKAAEQSIRESENNIIRDVRIAWLNAQNARERFRITTQLLQNANRSFELAQARYQNGASSIVELNQAQLDQVSAEIALSRTRYEYLLRVSALDFQTGTLK